MDDVLQALAKMLNMTTDEVSSLLSTFKGNAPQIYETLLKEKMMYDVFGFFEKISLITLIISLIILIISIYYYHFYNASDVTDWDVPNWTKKETLKSELIENKKRTFRPLLKSSCITSSASFITFITSVVLKTILAQNYIFIMNEVLPRLTHR
jgi:hypothetical protein|nr:MAG TPA: hypothetical protein [Caudoviricetes sp.]